MQIACEPISRKDKAFLQYQKIKTGLDEVEATMSQMTLQQIKQRSEYFNSQMKQINNFKQMVEILTYHDKQISSSDFDNTFERIQNLINIVRDAENQDDFMDGQEPTTNIEPEIDNKISDEQSHQFIESVETKNPVDDLLQEPQHQLIEIDQPQYPTVEDITVETIIQVRQRSQSAQLQSPHLQQQQIKSSDIQIEIVDIYERRAQLKQLVINEIEGQNNKLVADYKFGYDTLDLKQVYADSVKKFDTFRGGTKFIYNPRPIIFSESGDKTMEEIMFGAQTAKQSQRKYQDSMKGNPKSGDKRKTQKSVKFQIEEDKVIKAYVTHWQELEKHIRVQQRQEQKSNQNHYAISSTRPTVSSLAGVWWRG